MSEKTVELGIYEQLLNNVISQRLSKLKNDSYYIDSTILDKEEAARYLTSYLSKVVMEALNSFQGDSKLNKQIQLVNKVIKLLQTELSDEEFDDDLVSTEGKVLNAILSKVNRTYSDFDSHIKAITPYTRLSQSELFTGSNRGISLESEIKKEILSSNKIYFLVSFIKWSGLRIFKDELEQFTANPNNELKVISTSYMGATDLQAIKYLASLPNTKLKISYNHSNERLHAKAYLFFRNTGFHTGYIGSSNMSRSALTNGLEWNLKVTMQEISHIISKFQQTFESYWMNNEFEDFDVTRDTEKLRKALKAQKANDHIQASLYFDLKPHPYQVEILDKLKAEREVHNRWKNLIVAATGTGKTIVSAFDYKQFYNNNKFKLLFVAHREEILRQSRAMFQAVLKNNNFGELWVGGEKPSSFDHLFVSVQTFNSNQDFFESDLTADFYDYIIIDEVHHITASSYRPILKKFTPKILLGLTATPERLDGGNILADFCDTIAAEIRLPEAINRGFLCPFQYFGLSDSIDVSQVNWRNGGYDKKELEEVYTQNTQRVGDIIDGIDKFLTDKRDVIALGFCVSKSHAKFMAERFVEAGLKAEFLTSDSNSELRAKIKDKLLKKEVNYLFVVDIYNEGIDIKEIDTILFLRPTESLTIFLQQLGRGLRLTDDNKKEILTVLDFVGNARVEYDFEHKFRALIGKTHRPIEKEIEDGFPHLPLGCSIVLEKKAREIILENIRNAIGFNRNQLISKIANWQHQSTLPLTIKNFIAFHQLELQQIYRKDSWKRLCAEARVIKSFEEPNIKEFTSAISRKFIACNSKKYFDFIIALIDKNFEFKLKKASEEERLMALMFHYDIYQVAGSELGFKNLNESIKALSKNPTMIEELKEVILLLIDRISIVDKEIDLGFPMPLSVHCRYNRDQIFVAFELSTFEKKSSNREGVADIKDKNVELLFVTLQKSEKDYSPTTMYNDFAKSESVFHWQTQNSGRPDRGRGKSYVEHEKLKKRILLFVREQNDDEYGFTMSYVFLGDAQYINHEGSKPMSIDWKLEEPMPAYLWRDSAKMVIG